MSEIGLPRGIYDRVHSSGEEAWQHLRRRDDAFYAALGRRCFHIGPARDDNMLDGAGLERVDDLEAAEFLLNTGPSGWDETVEQYESLLRAARRRELRLGCAFAVGVVVLLGGRSFCAGGVAERYAVLGGRVGWLGKPFRGVYETCFAALGIADRRRILAVGDSLRTDIAGANGAGIDSLLVTGGIHAEEFGLSGGQPDLDRLMAAVAASGQRPDAVIAHFRW